MRAPPDCLATSVIGVWLHPERQWSVVYGFCWHPGHKTQTGITYYASGRRHLLSPALGSRYLLGAGEAEVAAQIGGDARLPRRR
jgi:hypothetical protein